MIIEDEKTFTNWLCSNSIILLADKDSIKKKTTNTYLSWSWAKYQENTENSIQLCIK